MVALHIVRIKRPYRHFSYTQRLTSVDVMRITAFDVLEKAASKGLKISRDRALRMYQKYVDTFTHKSSYNRSKEAMLSHVGYGFFTDKGWDVDDWYWPEFKAVLYSDIKTRKEKGSIIRSAEFFKPILNKQFLLCDDKDVCEIGRCKCGALFHRDFSINRRDISRYRMCNSCITLSVQIESDKKELDEVNRLLNKLKKVIKDENKKS